MRKDLQQNIFRMRRCLSELLFVWGWGVFAVREQAVSATQEVFKCVVFQETLVNPHLVKFSNVSIAHVLKSEQQKWNKTRGRLEFLKNYRMSALSSYKHYILYGILEVVMSRILSLIKYCYRVVIYKIHG